MHTGDKMTGMVCKCMDCAAARYARAEDRARQEEGKLYYDLMERRDFARDEAKRAEQEAKSAGSALRDLVMQHYRDLMHEGDS